jgi:hypothetical protein
MAKQEQKYYQSKYERIRGSNDKELFYEARQIYNKYGNKNKRRLPYARSKYFGGQKVFLNEYFKHLNDKLPSERKRRVVFLKCAIDLIINNKFDPVQNFIADKIEYYRFAGISADGHLFVVQISKNKKGNRYFMSAFPVNNLKAKRKGSL